MNWKSKELNNLVTAFVSLETPDETRRFMRDLMTEKEIVEFSKRLQAARMLSDEISYVEIVKKTGLSSTTVARVAKWLSGKKGGYRAMLEKLHHTTSPKG